MDLNLYQRQIIASKQYLIVWTTLMYWDWFILFSKEYRHIIKARWTPLKVAYLLNRYGTLIGGTASTIMVLATIKPSTCDRIHWIETLSLTLTVFITDVVLAIRIYAMYGRTKKALVALSTLLAIELAWMVGAGTQIIPVVVPVPIRRYIGLNGCVLGTYRPGSFEGIVTFYSCAPFCINTILLGATFYKNYRIQKETGKSLPVMQRMLADGLQYYVVITVFNFLNLYFYTQDNPTLKGFNVPAVMVTSSTMSCRLALSLFDTKPAAVASRNQTYQAPRTISTGGKRLSRTSRVSTPSSALVQTSTNTVLPTDTCGRLFWAQPFCLVYVVLITDAMLINRVVILYERDRKVLAGYLKSTFVTSHENRATDSLRAICRLSAVFTVEAVTMIAAATQVGYLKLPPPVAVQLNLEGCLAQGYRGNTFPGIVIFL
ncbi:hypothetical protein JCM5353_008242 [Sporobolomyces roseus]